MGINEGSWNQLREALVQSLKGNFSVIFEGRDATFARLELIQVCLEEYSCKAYFFSPIYSTFAIEMNIDNVANAYFNFNAFSIKFEKELSLRDTYGDTIYVGTMSLKIKEI